MNDDGEPISHLQPATAGASSYFFLNDPQAETTPLDSLLREEVVGLDTETYWNPAENRSRASLVQVASAAGQILVVDVLSVGAEIVRPLVESAAVRMVAHNARFDEWVLRGEGLQPASLVDTLYLSRAALRLPSHSLKAVAAHLLGVTLDKSFQKSNWRRRPLSAAQLEYAAADALVTLRVYHKLLGILTEQGKLEKALRGATLLRTSEETARTPRPRRLPKPPPRPLTAEERRAVRQLKAWRLERANRTHVPAYRVCPDATLEQLVCERPTTLAALTAIYGMGEARIAAFGEELLEELRRALN